MSRSDPLDAARGCVTGTLIGIVLLILVVLLAGCEDTMTIEKRRLMSHQLLVMQAVGGGVIPDPSIVYVKSEKFKIGAQANCNNWTISLNWYVAAEHPEFTAFTLIPHEYAHLLSCHFRGGVGKDPHDEYWRKIVVRLGGDPEYI
jgi:predicted SprT family Zn-dependent metalloprotease